MSQREVFIVGAVRTAIGSFGCSLKDVPLNTLATTVLREALEDCGVVATVLAVRAGVRGSPHGPEKTQGAIWRARTISFKQPRVRVVVFRVSRRERPVTRFTH